MKAGAFHLYIDSGLPVIPASTISGLFWRKGFFHRCGTAVYEIGSAFPACLAAEVFMEILHHSVIDRSHELVTEAGSEVLFPSKEAVIRLKNFSRYLKLGCLS
ncbi:hypothetical protein MO867_04605 [Microbulbifer sp. OS29]|uniref:Uncharacterized protein n=1 Tax=Microbulbifer okhotskensis TaxID=2926617 RepID=A0A9X2EJY6_9GAMM|nr:hypothetical protein [Microbulbifer okhotskensis]MCO1333617.1 hypothetical protein [Microbulbifer okhotskensis]